MLILRLVESIVVDDSTEVILGSGVVEWYAHPRRACIVSTTRSWLNWSMKKGLTGIGDIDTPHMIGQMIQITIKNPTNMLSCAQN